jgi:hypothetical protein
MGYQPLPRQRAAMSFNGVHRLRPGESFTPLRSKEAAALKCASCAAPVGPHEARCSYCLSWNPAYLRLSGIDALEVTTMADPVPRYWVGLESPVTGGYVGSSKPNAVLQAHGTISESERRAAEDIWRKQHEIFEWLDRSRIKQVCRWLLGIK